MVMPPHILENIQRAHTDDRPLWDLMAASRGYTAMLIAHDLKLFALLGERPRALADICAALQLAEHPAEALLTMLQSLSLVQAQNGHYGLTPLAAEALVETSPTYMGWYLDREIANEAVFSFRSLKDALVHDVPLTQHGDRRMFIYAMHSMSMGAALAWPKALDLAEHRLLLDIGGGSGAHAIGATIHWPHLQAVVFDRDAETLNLAREFIEQYGVAARVRTQLGDMLSEPFPVADLHLFSAIYHHWSAERGRLLSAKSFASLPPGGRIIIHERPYEETHSGPLAVVALTMLALMRGEAGPYSSHDYASLLTDAGFVDIAAKPTVGYWRIITGRKP
jgi:methylase of polypeptide subunit release factors